VSWVSFPQINCASLSSAFPSSIKRYTGFSDAPLKKTASYPANLRYGPKSPPEFASPHVSVSGDLATTVNLPQKGTAVPVTGPVKKPRIFPGPKGLTPLFQMLLDSHIKSFPCIRQPYSPPNDTGN
jgi:hypothetical protein